MRKPRIYTPQPLQAGSHITLSAEARHHLVNVLRCKNGQDVLLFNGKDPQEASATITAIDRKSVQLDILDTQTVDTESPLDTCLVQAISSSDRMDYTVQKNTELGITRFQPIYTALSQKPWQPDRLEKKLRHWQTIIINTCEQCGRTRLPELLSPIHLDDYLQNRDTQRSILLLEPTAQHPLTHHTPTPQTDFLIGPESGFTDTEIQHIQQHNIQAYRFGPRVFRTETAGLMVLGWLQATAGDLKI